MTKKGSVFIGSTLLFILFMLAGCSSSAVFLSDYYVAPEKVQRVQNALKASQLNVNISHIAAPHKLSHPLLITNPMLFDADYIATIRQAVLASGYRALDVITLSYEQHFYNGHNVGLYLPEDNRPHLPLVMRTENCGDAYATLEFSADGQQFTLERDLPNGDLRTLQGKVVLTSARNLSRAEPRHFELQWPNGQGEFLLERSQIETFFGLRTADIVTLSEPHVFGLPDACQFMTIYGQAPD